MRKVFSLSLAILSLVIGGGYYNYQMKQAEEQALDATLLANLEALVSIELPEVSITCDKPDNKKGLCFGPFGKLVMCGEYTYNECVWMGSQMYSCYPPC